MAGVLNFDTDGITRPPRLAKFFLGTVSPVHLTGLRECFLYLTELREPAQYTDATGAIVTAIAKGDAMIPVFFDNTITWLKLNDVHYAPGSDKEHNLISVSGLYAAGISVEWKSDDTHGCSLLDITLDVVARGYSRGCKWYLDVDLDVIRHNNPDIHKLYPTDLTPETSNESLGIQPFDPIGASEEVLSSFNQELALEGESPHINSGVGGSIGCFEVGDWSTGNTTSTRPLSLIHSDFYGPLPVSAGGNRYVASFVDDYSRFVRVFFLKSTSAYLTAVKTFVNRIQKDHQGRKPQRIYTGKDGGHVSLYLSVEGITHKAIPQTASVAQHFNLTLLKRVDSMLSDAGMEQGWWEDAAAMAVYIFNRSPSPHLEFNLPVDVLTQSQKGPGMTPSSFVYRAFGSGCTATLVETRAGKVIKKDIESRVLRFDDRKEEWVVLALTGDKVFSTKGIVFADHEDGRK